MYLGFRNFDFGFLGLDSLCWIPGLGFLVLDFLSGIPVLGVHGSGLLVLDSWVSIAYAFSFVLFSCFGCSSIFINSHSFALMSIRKAPTYDEQLGGLWYCCHFVFVDKAYIF